MRTVLFFIGYERSRHSLLGALLDAHPHMVVSDESMAFGKWRSNINKWISSSIYSFFDIMVQTSQRDVAKGKRSQVFEGSVANATSRFKYFVPNQWQGSFDQYIEVRTIWCVTFAIIKGYSVGISCIWMPREYLISVWLHYNFAIQTFLQICLGESLLITFTSSTMPFNFWSNWKTINCNCYIARLSLNKMSTVIGWLLVTCPWSNSNDRDTIAKLLPARRLYFLIFAIWLFKEKSKYATKHLKCIWHNKIFLLIWKAFQNTGEWRFSFWNIFFYLEILTFFSYAN